MKISGFTLIRNGTEFDYPFLESLNSLLPLVDELVVNVGYGTDDTLARIQSWANRNPKIIIFQSEWPLNDPEKKKGGLILSEQTNLALDRCTGDWCIYLQADEIFHEEDYPAIRGAFARAEKLSGIDGLLFDYVHFYGSFDVIQHSRSAYRREVRAIRRSSEARSIGDAQSFRTREGEKLHVIQSGARVFHYGWVREPGKMREKTYFMDQLYHGKPGEGGVPQTGDNYRYKKIWGLRRFRATHPAVMRERISKKGWHWDLESSPLEWHWRDLKKVVLDSLERLTGHRFFEYRSYRLTGRSRVAR